MLLCGIATQAVSMLKLRLLKGEFCVSVPATWPLVGGQLSVIYMFCIMFISLFVIGFVSIQVNECSLTKSVETTEGDLRANTSLRKH